MRNLALLPVAVALLVIELARAMVRAFELEDSDEIEQFRRPGGGWHNR